MRSDRPSSTAKRRRISFFFSFQVTFLLLYRLDTIESVAIIQSMFPLNPRHSNSRKEKKEEIASGYCRRPSCYFPWIFYSAQSIKTPPSSTTRNVIAWILRIDQTDFDVPSLWITRRRYSTFDPIDVWHICIRIFFFVSFWVVIKKANKITARKNFFLLFH